MITLFKCQMYLALLNDITIKDPNWLGDWPVGYLRNAVEELNSGPLPRNKSR